MSITGVTNTFQASGSCDGWDYGPAATVKIEVNKSYTFVPVVWYNSGTNGLCLCDGLVQFTFPPFMQFSGGDEWNRIYLVDDDGQGCGGGTGTGSNGGGSPPPGPPPDCTMGGGGPSPSGGGGGHGGNPAIRMALGNSGNVGSVTCEGDVHLNASQPGTNLFTPAALTYP